MREIKDIYNEKIGDNSGKEKYIELMFIGPQN